MKIISWLDGLRNQFAISSRSRSRKRRITNRPAAQVSGESLENRLLLTSTFINAGGSDISGDPMFQDGDDFENGAARSSSTRASIDTSGVDSDFPEAVFQSVNWDPKRGPEMQFDVPVTPGAEYEVDLLFSEIYRGGFRTGARVFDVSLEGDLVLNDLDVFSEVGDNAALAKSFNITATDANLDIDFGQVGRGLHPIIAGIAVREVGDGGGGDDGGDDGGGNTNSAPTISNVPNQTVDENQVIGPLSFAVNDADGDTVTVTASSSNSSVVAPGGLSVTGTGTNRSLTVTPVADAAGQTTVTLVASDGQASVTDQFLVTINEDDDGPVDPPPPPPSNSEAIFLNAGGGSVGEFQAADSFHSRTRTSGTRKSISDVPAGIPQSVFQSSTFNPSRFGDLEFNIPNNNGESYQVDLLFSEYWRRAFSTGVRQFDVSIDGNQVLNDFDIFAEAGARTALVKTFTVMGDGNLDIDLSHVRNNPAISGIIVTPLDGGGSQNRAPMLAPIANQTTTVNGTVQVTASATDPDGDNLTYSILTQTLPGTPSISPQLGTFSWTPPSAGVFNVTLQASDGTLTDTETFAVTVDAAPPANQPPVFAALASQQATVGSQLSFTVSATDPDPGDTVSYFLNPSAPSGVSVGATTGVVTWTPSANQTGTLTFPIFASDGTASVSQTATVTVTAPSNNSAPVLSPIGNQTATPGQPLTFTAFATDADGPGEVLQFSLAPGAPAGATINANTGDFSWTPPFGSAAPVSFSVEVSDGTAFDSETITVFFQGTNQAPTIAAIGDVTAQEGSLVQVSVIATDPNAGDTLTYSLDTTGLPGSPSIDATTGVFTWTPPIADGPGFQITVRATDNGGLFDTESFTVAVIDAPNNNTPPVLALIPDQNAAVGQQLTFTATATDADLPGDTLSFFLDPSAPTGATIDSSTGVVTWTPNAPGTFNIPVVVSDGTDSDSQDVGVNVTAGAPNTAPSFGPVGNQDAVVNQQFQLTLPVSDPENDPLTFTLLTTDLPGNAAVNATTGVFTWTPTSSGPVFEVMVRVTDSGGLSDEVTFNVTVEDSDPGGNRAPVLQAVPNQDAEPGTLLTFTAVATDADGDALSYFLDPTAPNGASIDVDTGVFTWTPTTADLGPVNFPILVSDGTATVFQSVSVVVSDDGGGGGGPGNNSSPSFGPQNDLSVAAGSTVQATFEAFDPDAGDTLTYTLVTTTLPGTPSVNAQTGVFTWTPPASAAGTSFDVMIRATDAGGLSDDALFRVNVTTAGPGGGGGGGNSAPVFDNTPDQLATVGTQLTFTVTATDADGDVLDFFLDPSAPVGSNMTSAGVFTWTPTASNVGSVTFPVFVFDGSSNVSQDVTVIVSS